MGEAFYLQLEFAMAAHQKLQVCSNKPMGQIIKEVHPEVVEPLRAYQKP